MQKYFRYNNTGKCLKPRMYIVNRDGKYDVILGKMNFIIEYYEENVSL